MYGIIEGPDNGWVSTQTLVTFAVAIVVLVAFVAWELQAKEPMLDLRFFRNPRFTAATTAITLVFFAMFGSYFLFTQYLQFVHGYDPLSAGVRMLPWALAYMLSATQSAKLVERFGQRSVVASGSHDRRVRPRDRGGDEHPDVELLAVRARGRRAGVGHGHHHRAVDGRDHAVVAVAQGGRRLGGERHHP